MKHRINLLFCGSADPEDQEPDDPPAPDPKGRHTMARDPRDLTLEDRERERDLVLNPFQYAYILDLTKGHVNVYVGPHKTSLANTDRPVRFSPVGRRFEEGRLEDAIQEFVAASEGDYVVLENPAMDEAQAHANSGSNSMTKLHFGRKINIPGSVTFPLWPGQTAKVIPGHNLRSNQYLLVRVYNEEAAKANWAKAIVKAVVRDGDARGGEGAHAGESPLPAAPSLVTGQLLIIKGTEVSFYIPPTGLEVVPDEAGKYTRDAVTLERLEYCVLLNENGNKRYVRGPAVVFPEPTETFVTRGGHAKFRAIELNELMGLYVKVIAPYDEDGRHYREGEELFLTGRDQMIYFPRPEHALIRYGNQEIHYALAIPKGEARYVLDKETGQISLVKGPRMFLPDPRKEVIIRRILTPSLCDLLYPGNNEALAHNMTLSKVASSEKGSGFVTERALSAFAQGKRERADPKGTPTQSIAQAWDLDETSASDDMERKASYTPPSVMTLNTKFDGAVAINVWTGYAVLLVSRSGSRRVVVGPETALLEYDESPQILELSTGTPKTDRTIKTGYLRVANNKVSDEISAVTRDLVEVAIRVSYRVNFEGGQDAASPETWFNVENYVNFLCDHTRSLIRNAAKSHGIDDFNQHAIAIVRDTILGTPDAEGKRTGRKFVENGMRIYDVEVLDIRIGDEKIREMLIETQHTSVAQAITLAERERELENTKKGERITQEIASARANTETVRRTIEATAHEEAMRVRLAEVEAQSQVREASLKSSLEEQEAIDRIQQAELARARAAQDQRLEIATRDQALQTALLEAEAQVLATKAGAITPQLTSAIQSFGDKVFVERLMAALGPHALLRGNSIADILAQLVNGNPDLGRRIEGLVGKAIGKEGQAEK